MERNLMNKIFNVDWLIKFKNYHEFKRIVTFHLKDHQLIKMGLIHPAEK